MNDNKKKGCTCLLLPFQQEWVLHGCFYESSLLFGSAVVSVRSEVCPAKVPSYE